MKKPDYEKVSCSNCPAVLERPKGSETVCVCGTTIGKTLVAK